MIVTGAAVVPGPPLLIPEVAAGAAGELEGLRAACVSALTSVLADDPAQVLVLGAGPATQSFGAGSWGTLAGFGVPVDIALSGPAVGVASLPLALGVGAWLLSEVGWSGPSVALALHHGMSNDAAQHTALGTVSHRRTALLVVGDGSACRTEKAPGALDPRAEAFDAACAAALAGPDLRRLGDLDAELAGELLCAGRTPWAAAAALCLRTGSNWSAELLAEELPYGVAYWVARWVAG